MIRLFTTQPLQSGAALVLDDKQSHYLLHVMRAGSGDDILMFNGRDGEWRGVVEASKKSASVKMQNQTREQKTEPDLWLCFAPIKRGHGDMVAEKASELGVSKLLPVITRHTIVSRVPVDRIEAIAREAAEQCERLTVPEVAEAQTLPELLKNWDPARRLIFCAEAGDARPMAEVLAPLTEKAFAIITGPEGGFAEEEFALLRKQPFVTPVRLGPRILRADTAALAALTLLQAHKGDWK